MVALREIVEGGHGMTDSGEFNARPSRRANPQGSNCQADLTDSLSSGALLTASLEDRQARLASVIAGKIVPRLQTMHHTLSGHNAAAAFDSCEIEEFGALLIQSDGAESSAFFDKMRSKGHSIETLFIGLLSEAARHLGELWEQDYCDFVEVTLGVARLQNLLCRFGGVDEPTEPDNKQRALLLTLPGEKHVFGANMVAVFMRNASWDVSLRHDLDDSGVSDAVTNQWFGVIGITLSAESGLEKLARTIRTVRDCSANAEIGVIVGGPLFRRHPNLVSQVGADATAPDAPTATLLAKKLILRQTGAKRAGAPLGRCQ
ncbi:MAG: coenzyme B12-binding protein [Methylocystis sp.]|nr:MAG: coenzyme B12-binding protein [Methylocystis sp.]